MLIVLSPAKSLDYDTPPITKKFTQPDAIGRSAELIDILRTYSPAKIASLMRISDPLAALNVGRFSSWTPECTTENAKQAVLAFSGDVYQGLDATSLNAQQLDYLQSHLRILSGLYGVLRPLDLLQPYRLEMGTKLANPHGKDLYAFWGTVITDVINSALRQHKTRELVNLASEEYFKAVQPTLLNASVITPVFHDWSSGKYKIVSFYAKRARGLMARYAALHRITQAEQLKAFDSDGYAFYEAASNDASWVFLRRQV